MSTNIRGREMGQVEILDFLKSHPDRWFSAVEIAMATTGKPVGQFQPLRVLRDSGEVLVQERDGREHRPRYLYKHKGEQK